jgi:hypothetical protein
MEKTIFQIAFAESIVFSCAEVDTIISFSAAGLRWWFQTEDGKYSLADVLEHNNDLNRATVEYARKLASDWFEHCMKAFANAGDDSDSDEMIATTYESGKVISTSIVTVAPPSTSITGAPVVEPLFLDANKKDVHTEHCCAIHRHCKYGNRKCTVTNGQKKPSYPCNCKER